MKKSEMIEFCRKAIIMANNPECKTYEEACNQVISFDKAASYKYTTSYISYDYSPPDLSYTNHEGVSYCVEKCKKYEAFIFPEINGVYFLENDFYNEHDLYYKNILGKSYILVEQVQPIYELTLERVLVVLYQRKQIQPLISYAKNRDMSISIFLQKDLDIQAIVTYGIKASHLFTWQPNKTLENQDDKTIETIYGIFNGK